MQPQQQPRVRHRVPCTVASDAGYRQGLVLNLSRTGLFVQTNLPPRPGTCVRVGLATPGKSEVLHVEADVVWRHRVNTRVTGTAQSGMGLRIRGDHGGYDRFLRDELPEAFEEPEATEEAVPAHAFEVRMGLRGTNRSRALHIQAHDAEDAVRRAREQMGERWMLVELRER